MIVPPLVKGDISEYPTVVNNKTVYPNAERTVPNTSG